MQLPPILIFFTIFQHSSACSYTPGPFLIPIISKTPKLPKICPKSLIQPSAPQPGHSPWTHPPSCSPLPSSRKTLCVYTNANYHSAQGLSIVGQPEIIDSLTHDGLFLDPSCDSTPAFKASMKESAKETKYEMRNKSGMGLGLFVKPTQSYQTGEVIMTDYPTLILPAEGFSGGDGDEEVLRVLAWKALLQLPKKGRELTRGLARSKPEVEGLDEIVDLVDTNAFAHEKGGGVWNLVFSGAARMNHGCLPNTITRTDPSTLSLSVIALSALSPGTQIFNSYLDPSQESSSAERQHLLSSTWKFRCRCDICSGPGVRASDARRRAITKIKERIEGSKGDAEGLLKHAEKLLKLYDEEGMVLPKGDYLELAAMAGKYTGRRKKGVEYAKMAKRHWEVLMGEESQEAQAMGELEMEMARAE